VEQGESLTPLRAASFALIWAGVGVFAFAAWRRSRSARAAASAAAAVQEAA
jgi:chloramphenicol-sensitive protein RarD